MKKILALFLCFAFIGCNQATDNKSENITTATPAAVKNESVTTTTPATPQSNSATSDSRIVETTVAPKTTPPTIPEIKTTTTTAKPSTPSNDNVVKDLITSVPLKLFIFFIIF